MEGLGGTRQSEEGHSGLLAEPLDAASREPSCSAPSELLIEGTCFRETASEPGIAKSRLALLARCEGWLTAASFYLFMDALCGLLTLSCQLLAEPGMHIEPCPAHLVSLSSLCAGILQGQVWHL